MRFFKSLKPSKRSAICGMLSASKDEGQALIEVSIAVPILLLVFVAAAETARIAYASIEVMNAASAGVQYGTENVTAAADSGGIQIAAQNDAANITLDSVSSQTSCICSNANACSTTGTPCPGASAETVLTVKTQTTFNPGFHLPGIPSSFTLKGQAIQKVLQ